MSLNILNLLISVHNAFMQKNKKHCMYIIVNVINDCNYNCYYCYNLTTNNKVRNKLCLDLDRLYLFAKWCKENINDNIEIDILGGEPTLHPKLLDFCIKLYENNIAKCHITTNFSATNQYIEELLKLSITLNLSWHSLPNDRYNKAFIEKVNRIPFKYFEKQQLAAVVMCEPAFYKESFFAFDSLYKKFPKNVQLNLIDNNHLTDIEKSAFSKLYDYTNDILFELEKRNDKIFHLNLDWLNLVFTYSNNSVKHYTSIDLKTNPELCDFYHFKCYAGIDSVSIDYNGNIIPCDDFNSCMSNKKIIGNIYTTYKKEDFHFVICNTHSCTCPYHTSKEKLFH